MDKHILTTNEQLYKRMHMKKHIRLETCVNKQRCGMHPHIEDIQVRAFLLDKQFFVELLDELDFLVAVNQKGEGRDDLYAPTACVTQDHFSVCTQFPSHSRMQTFPVLISTTESIKCVRSTCRSWIKSMIPGLR